MIKACKIQIEFSKFEAYFIRQLFKNVKILTFIHSSTLLPPTPRLMAFAWQSMWTMTI